MNQTWTLKFAFYVLLRSFLTNFFNFKIHFTQRNEFHIEFYFKTKQKKKKIDGRFLNLHYG